MKKVFVFSLVLLVLVSCSLLPFLNPIKTGMIACYCKSGGNFIDFDFDAKGEVERKDSLASYVDIILEPWFDNSGNPMPTIMLNISSPDSFSFIMDLGIISLDDALKLSDSDLMPDSFSMDLQAKKDHVYYVISTPERKEYFMLVDSIKIDEGNATYDAEVFFKYVPRK
ncbi:MAG: hypothetical protein QME48_07770 [bacterium]|nr:MAG: hypothetical protein XD76_1226 [candidate division TA06 bacterium 32_111]KUK87021.1 MAG: hypothetical protein XE03_1110 [candidate division TA06 bacterium 34_109]MDI6701106.1 hypothetical protein [bacterium]